MSCPNSIVVNSTLLLMLLSAWLCPVRAAIMRGVKPSLVPKSTWAFASSKAAAMSGNPNWAARCKGVASENNPDSVDYCGNYRWRDLWQILICILHFAGFPLYKLNMNPCHADSHNQQTKPAAQAIEMSRGATQPRPTAIFSLLESARWHLPPHSENPTPSTSAVFTCRQPVTVIKQVCKASAYGQFLHFNERCDMCVRRTSM